MRNTTSALVVVATLVRVPLAGQDANRAAPLPYELAFAHNQFPWLEDPAVSPTGIGSPTA